MAAGDPQQFRFAHHTTTKSYRKLTGDKIYPFHDVGSLLDRVAFQIFTWLTSQQKKKRKHVELRKWHDVKMMHPS
jgi:hypothetical protein